jgi:hypothetical protein
MSHSLPISDAGLGSIAYTFEFLMGFMGSPARWRTMPWMVTIFGILVIPLGLVHIFLVISQPVVVGLWCTFCLIAAFIMLPMIPLEMDEVIAMIQFLKRKLKAGEKFWHVFWKGGADEEDKGKVKKLEDMPDLYSLPDKPGRVFMSSLWGMNFPWTLTVSSIIGLTVVGLPSWMETNEFHQKILQATGLLTFTFAIIAMGETLRTFRFLNVLLGIVIGASGFILSSNGPMNLFGASLGVMIILLALPRGKIQHNFDSWDRYIK